MEYFRTGDGSLHVPRIFFLVTAVALAAIQLGYLGHPRKIDDPYLWLNYLWFAGCYAFSCGKSYPKELGLQRLIGAAMMLGSFVGNVYFS